MILKSDRLDPSIVAQVTNEAVVIPAGNAGDVVEAQLAERPILDSDGTPYASQADTSLSLTSTAFTTEVKYGVIDTDLTNGDYWVDYATGKIRGKKADNSVAMTATYKVPRLNTNETGGSGNPTVVAIESTSRAATVGFATKLQVSGNSTKLYRAQIYNKSASTYYVMIFDSVAEPVDTTVPTSAPIPISSGGFVGVDYPFNPVDFTNGCWIMISSTDDTLTEIVSNDVFIDADYIDN